VIDLTGRRALVTGGSRGIGAATAELFAEAGADVAITYRSRRADAERVAARIRARGRRAHVAQADLADSDAVGDAFQRAADALGGLDAFVANAGIWPATEVPVREMTAQRWGDTMRANLDTVFLTTRAALGIMGGRGSIVLVSSTAGQRGEAFHADYAATKGALIALTKSLAIESAPGVTVNCVAPGWVDTEMTASAFAGEARARIAESIPLGRIPSPRDIAGPIVFLCSPLARHITGEVLNVNGGSVLCG
jgi:3-oxoacyl-[acyl-carrier protein] reductase